MNLLTLLYLIGLGYEISSWCEDEKITFLGIIRWALSPIWIPIGVGIMIFYHEIEEE